GSLNVDDAAPVCSGVPCRYGGARRKSEVEHRDTRAFGIASIDDVPPQARVAVVGVDHCYAMVGKNVQQGRMLRCHFGYAAHEFLMLALRVVDERYGRLSDRGERGRLASMVHADLERSDAVRCAK